MMHPVSASHAAAHASYAAQEAVNKPSQPAQKPESWPQDKVTIKGNSGDADGDGDRK